MRDDHRERATRSYRVTADSQRFLTDFVGRMLDQADDMRTGSNYWLYGYYGSGKSHLLTVLDGLLDTDWLAGRQATVWDDLVGYTADEVTAPVETDDRPDEKRATELLEEAGKLLERIHNAKTQLDDSPDGSVVVLEEESDPSE